jgi:hypothetical protein
MSKLASKVVEQARAWLGLRESDGSHKKIIDIYNAHKPLARGYRVKYDDAWCATFVSAVAIKLGYTDIIPTECSCIKMVELLKKKGDWVENENCTPAPGWIIFYDWQDNGEGDNIGSPDHVGIVEKVSGDLITVIEGNFLNGVKRRALMVNGVNIRGYGVPKYDPESVKEEECTVNVSVLKKGSKGSQVKALQALLIGYGYSCGSSGVDGSFGNATLSAVKKYQSRNGLESDGSVGPKTWAKLLGV